MRGVSRQVSRDSGEYALDRQSGQDKTGQSRDSMHDIWRRKSKAMAKPLGARNGSEYLEISRSKEYVQPADAKLG